MSGDSYTKTQRQFLAGKRVLLAEDNEDLRLSGIRLLERVGAEVVAAEDGMKALTLALKNSVDIVIADYHLPKMNGLQVALRLKDLEHPAKIALLTASCDEDELNSITGIPILSKPLRLEEVAEELI